MADVTILALTGDGMMPIEKIAPWAVNYHSADFIAGTHAGELKAAPTRADSALYITHVTLGLVANAANNIISDANLKLVDGSGITVFGPVQLQANGQGVFSKDFEHPLKIVNQKALDISGVGAGGSYQSACFVFVEGLTGDKPLG